MIVNTVDVTEFPQSDFNELYIKVVHHFRGLRLESDQIEDLGRTDTGIERIGGEYSVPMVTLRHSKYHQFSYVLRLKWSNNSNPYFQAEYRPTKVSSKKSTTVNHPHVDETLNTFEDWLECINLYHKDNLRVSGHFEEFYAENYYHEFEATGLLDDHPFSPQDQTIVVEYLEAFAQSVTATETIEPQQKEQTIVQLRQLISQIGVTSKRNFARALAYIKAKIVKLGPVVTKAVATEIVKELIGWGKDNAHSIAKQLLAAKQSIFEFVIESGQGG